MKTKTYPPTPELDKMKAVQEKSQVIGEFIDSLSAAGLHLCDEQDNGREHDPEYWPTSKSIETILATYFEIDLVKVEKERCAILDHIRSA